MMKNLQELLQHITYERIEGSLDVEVQDITADSRTVKQGSLFICLSGAHVDGHKFVGSAVEKEHLSLLLLKRSMCLPG